MQDRQVAISAKGLLTHVCCDCHKSRDEVDALLDAYTDVTSPQFRAWYCKAIYAMGCQVFSDLAEQARKGKDQARYFSHLLKARLGA
jgi:hypothetical protein